MSDKAHAFLRRFVGAARPPRPHAAAAGGVGQPRLLRRGVALRRRAAGPRRPRHAGAAPRGGALRGAHGEPALGGSSRCKRNKRNEEMDKEMNE